MDSWRYKPARDLGLSFRQRLRSGKRESGLIGRVGHRAGSAVIAAFLRWSYGLKVEGREHLPAAPPFVLTANHSSHFDALVLASILAPSLRNSVFPIAAGDTFFKTPATATLAAGLLNALPMWRRNTGRHGIEDLRSRLTDDPCAFIMFPEGTRSRTGEIGSFKAGIGMIVAGTDVPVIPCFLRGTFNAWPPNSKWPRKGSRFTVNIGARLRFPAAANDRNGWEQIASDLEKAVRSLSAE